MTPAEEDALVNDLLEQWSSGRTALITLFRNAIRAAVAHERERAAKCADFHIKMANKHGWIIDSAIPAIAAAIRRGEE